MKTPVTGSLRDWVTSATVREKGPYFEAVPRSINVPSCSHVLCALLTALDVARGIKLLHKYKILHGDLKPHNVLLAEAPEVRPAGLRVMGSQPRLVHSSVAERSLRRIRAALLPS